MDTNSMKAMEEKKAELASLMQALVDGANEEECAMSEEEKERFDAAEAEARAIDATMERMNKAREFMMGEKRATGKTMTTAEAEERAFNAYIFGEELRSGEQNLSMNNNGAIIPTSIAQRIVKTVYEISPGEQPEWEEVFRCRASLSLNKSRHTTAQASEQEQQIDTHTIIIRLWAIP